MTNSFSRRKFLGDGIAEALAVAGIGLGVVGIGSPAPASPTNHNHAFSILTPALNSVVGKFGFSDLSGKNGFIAEQIALGTDLGIRRLATGRVSASRLFRRQLQSC